VNNCRHDLAARALPAVVRLRGRLRPRARSTVDLVWTEGWAPGQNTAVSAGRTAAETWSASRLAHNPTCRSGGHVAGEPVLSATGHSARAVVSCSRCAAYIASFEGPLPAVQAATAHWLHRDSPCLGG
jgi:hypothetical protein